MIPFRTGKEEARATQASHFGLEQNRIYSINEYLFNFRSHSIFTINIEMLDTGVDGGQHIRKVSKLVCPSFKVATLLDL